MGTRQPLASIASSSPRNGSVECLVSQRFTSPRTVSAAGRPPSLDLKNTAKPVELSIGSSSEIGSSPRFLPKNGQRMADSLCVRSRVTKREGRASNTAWIHTIPVFRE
jgi:hypothetical protein